MTGESVRIVIGNGDLTLDALQAVGNSPVRIGLDDAAKRRIADAAGALARIVGGPDAAYGVNTGFGKLCRTRVDSDQLAQLQVNLIYSHAVGVGPDMPPELVRLMMLLKVNALARGFSGITLETLECLIECLNHDILPVIPTQGSLGASGDLAPLAHMVLPLIGKGMVDHQGRRRTAESALAEVGLKPITLAPKEGLALINGTQFMLSYAVSSLGRAQNLMKHADLLGACTVEALQGSHVPFKPDLHALRPHPGAMLVAANLRKLLQESEINAGHATCGRVQDPYSLRCMPQVHGAVRDAYAHVRHVVGVELNAVTDNPVILEGDSVVSGGLFHGEPLALTLDYLAIAMAELASISERRTYLLLEGDELLPQLLTARSGVNSGLMIPHYTAAALVSENKGLATPAAVDSIPTSLGQEDHVSMGARSAVKSRQVVENCEQVLAVELLSAMQALDFHQTLKPGKGVSAAHTCFRQFVEHITEDRMFVEDMRVSVEQIRGGALLDAAEKAVGAVE